MVERFEVLDYFRRLTNGRRDVRRDVRKRGGLEAGRATISSARFPAALEKCAW